MLGNPRNPRWANAEKTMLNLTVNGEGNREMPITVTEDDDIGSLLARAKAGEFGPIAVYQPREVTDMHVEVWTRAERLRRVRDVYIDDERRLSLYGYYVHLIALGAENHSYDQKKEFAVLHAAAEWEEAMLVAARALREGKDHAAIVEDKSWPKLDESVAADLQKLALES